MRKRVVLFAMVLGALFAAPANAAFININDNDLANITLTAGDFEGGFFVDGVLLTQGLGSSASITFADGATHTISASWISSGAPTPLNILFALPASPTNVTSFVRFTMTDPAGILVSLSGDFGGFTGATYFVTALATNAQNGQVVGGAVPNLTVSFDSETPQQVPEPTSLMLLGFGLAGVGVRRWRQRTAS